MRPAEQVLTCLALSAAEVPCKTAPFASFSGRTEKGGPARPERVPMSFSLVQAIRKVSVMQEFYEIVLSGEFSLIILIVLQVSLTRLHFRCFNKAFKGKSIRPYASHSQNFHLISTCFSVA